MTPIARPLSDTLYLIKSIIKIIVISYSTLSVPSYAPHLPPIVPDLNGIVKNVFTTSVSRVALPLLRANGHIL